MSNEETALEADGLGMRYSRRKGHVLRDCSFQLPTGRICALVGANGAGKSTLLGLAAGLLRPEEGTLRLLGGTPAQARDRVAYVAQGKPLHPQLTVAETLRLGAELNPRRWNQEAAERVAYDEGPPPGARIRSLSGGQRTRVALALAFGKRAELLLLDEPMADLDPLARQRLTGALMAESVEHGTTIVMSSHVIAELEGSCDHLLLLGSRHIRLAGGCDEILDAHRRLTGMQGDFSPHTAIATTGTGRGASALVRTNGEPDHGTWDVEEVSLEEVVLAHLRNSEAPDLHTARTTAPSGQEAAA